MLYCSILCTTADDIIGIVVIKILALLLQAQKSQNSPISLADCTTNTAIFIKLTFSKLYKGLKICFNEISVVSIGASIQVKFIHNLIWLFV